MLSLALLVCVLCPVCLWLKYVRVNSSTHALPPAVPGKWPVIGHAHKLFKYFTDLQELLKYVSEDCAKQGGLTHFNFGSELYYLILDPQDAFTAANVCLKKHYVFDLGKVWMGDGLLLSSGDIWKRHRKMLTPAFTLPVIYGFLDVFNSQSKKLISSMESHVGKGLFDHYPHLKNNALETLCVGTFGIDVIDDVKFTQKYMKSVDQMINIGITRGINFWLQNDFIYKLVGMKKKEDEVVGTLHAMATKVLQKKKATMKNEASNNNLEPENSGNKYKPFLDLLLDLSKNGALTDKEIREEMDTIIAAGFETTSNQLTYTLLQLGAHPEVQEKLHEELLEVLGADRDVEKDDVNKLVYTNAVIMESLRTFPSVPVMFRNVDKDVKLKNYTMRAGSYCVIFPLATYFDPSWGAESDQFRPERWLDGDFRNNKEFAAFGLGKRACIGRTYAMISMKVTLAHFVRRYRVMADMSKLKLKYEFVMRPVSGHEISIERRTLLEVLGADRDVEKDDVNKLVYTNAVIMESLRTLPSVPVMLRCVDKEVKLKNYIMRAGSCCIIFPLATHFDSSWGAESDQFKPERWLDGDFRDKSFAALGLGKRDCIGRTYAMVSMKVTLAHYIRRYRVTADMSKLKMKFELVMRPLSGHEISIEQRT